MEKPSEELFASCDAGVSFSCPSRDADGMLLSSCPFRRRSENLGEKSVFYAAREFLWINMFVVIGEVDVRLAGVESWEHAKLTAEIKTLSHVNYKTLLFLVV